MGTTSKKAVTKTAPTAAPSTNTASFVNPTSPLAPEPKFTFSDAAGKFLRPVALSDVGKKYIDTLEEKFNELANNGEARVTMIAVPDLVEIRAFYNEANKLYILLYFNESYTANGVIPVVDKNADVAEYIYPPRVRTASCSSPSSSLRMTMAAWRRCSAISSTASVRSTPTIRSTPTCSSV